MERDQRTDSFTHGNKMVRLKSMSTFRIEHRTCAEEFWKVNRVESKKTNGFVLEEHQIKR